MQQTNWTACGPVSAGKMQAFPVIGCNWLDGLHAGLGIAVKNTWDKRDIGTPTDKPGSFIYLRVPVSVPSLKGRFD